MTLSASASMPLRPPWLHLGRAVWIVMALTTLLVFAVSQARSPAASAPSCAGTAACTSWVVSQEDIQLMNSRGPAGQQAALFIYLSGLLAHLSLPLVGLIIFWRRSDDWVALLLSASLVTVLIEGGPPSSLPAIDLAGRLVFGLGAAAFLPVLFAFPNGRLEPRWIGWVALPVSLVLAVVTFAIPTTSTSAAISALWLIWALLAAYSMIYRYYRVANAVERQQTKWAVVGLLCSFASIITWILGTFYPASQPSVARIGFLVFNGVLYLGGYLALSVCLTIAILRFRLWDIDLLINRALVYGGLTASLAVVYFGSVVILQALLEALTGTATRSPLAVVGSTLAIAALFAPLRRRLQDFIDRRFYRRKYDAAQTLAAFGAVARDETDLDRLAGELVDVINETVQPKGATIWLKPLAAEGRQSESSK